MTFDSRYINMELIDTMTLSFAHTGGYDLMWIIASMYKCVWKANTLESVYFGILAVKRVSFLFGRQD